MMLELSNGLQTLSSNYEDFHAGLVAYTSGVSSLAYNYRQLNSGLTSLAGGIGDLYDGVGELSNGTAELSDATNDIPDEVDEQINDLIGNYDKSGFTPTSFVSDKNVNTVSVQFVFKTDKIEKAETQTADTDTQSEKDLLDALLALFQ